MYDEVDGMIIWVEHCGIDLILGGRVVKKQERREIEGHPASASASTPVRTPVSVMVPFQAGAIYLRATLG